MLDTIPAGLLLDGAYIRHVPSPYTPSQARQYLLRIAWPTQFVGESDDSPIEFESNLENLTALMVHHCTTFPAENTDLHYTKEHRMPVKPDELFDRMVLGGRGSYCFGQNGLFLGMLRGLGYRAYGVSGRVLSPASAQYSPDPSSPLEGNIYTSLVHMTLLVQPYSDPALANITYVADMGFGGLGPMRPILFADGGDGDEQELPATDIDEPGSSRPRCKGGWAWGTFPPVRHRVIRGAHYSSSLETTLGSGFAPSREWHMQVTRSRLPSDPSHEEWTTLYTFSESEFFQRDIDAANVVTSTFEDMPFPHFVMCTKRFEISLDDIRQAGVYDGEDEGREVMRTAENVAEEKGIRWVGQWTLEGSKAFRRIGGKALEEVQFESEKDRVVFLRDRIGMGINEDDAQWIAGREAAI